MYGLLVVISFVFICQTEGRLEGQTARTDQTPDSMVNLKRKWELLFKAADINRDGVLSAADADECTKRLSSIQTFIEYRRKITQRDAMKKWWENCLLSTEKGESMKDYVKRRQSEYETSRPEFTKKMEKCFNDIFEIVDVNDDGDIDFKEYIDVFMTFAHEEDKLIIENYRKASPGARPVPLENMVDKLVKSTSHDLHHKGSMEYLIHKLERLFKAVDMNHDGEVSEADAEECCKRLTSMQPDIEERRKTTTIDAMKWWKSCIQSTDKKRESVYQFVDRRSRQLEYLKSKSTFIETCFKDILEIGDVNDDRYVDLKEYVDLYKAFADEDQKMVIDIYERARHGAKHVPLVNIVAEWVKFTSTNEPHQKYFLKEKFEERE